MRNNLLISIFLIFCLSAKGQKKHFAQLELGTGFGKERLVVDRYDFSPDLYNKFSFQAGICHNYRPTDIFKISLHLMYVNQGSTTVRDFVRINGDTLSPADQTKFTNFQFGLTPSLYLNQKRNTYFGFGPTLIIPIKYSVLSDIGLELIDDSQIMKDFYFGYMAKFGKDFMIKNSLITVEIRAIRSLGTLIDNNYHNDAWHRTTALNLMVAYGFPFGNEIKKVIKD